MEYPSIIREYFPDYAKQDTWNLFHSYVDSHSQSLIDEYPGYGLHAITILQSQCANMSFYKNNIK